jgi:hypothetical protein
LCYNDEAPGLRVRTRWSPPSCLKDLLHMLIGERPAIKMSDAAALFDYIKDKVTFSHIYQKIMLSLLSERLNLY